MIDFCIIRKIKILLTKPKSGRQMLFLKKLNLNTILQSSKKMYHRHILHNTRNCRLKYITNHDHKYITATITKNIPN